MGSFSFRSITLMLLITILIWFTNMESCNARRGKHWRQSRGVYSSLSKKKPKNHIGSYHHNHHGTKSKPKAPPPPPAPKPKEDGSSPPKKGYGNHPASAQFNVLDFGAKGDGTTDDTKSFEAAWEAACKVEASTVIIPSEFTFLVGPISFSGPYLSFLLQVQVWFTSNETHQQFYQLLHNEDLSGHCTN